jgi:hypothetical protein
MKLRQMGGLVAAVGLLLVASPHRRAIAQSAIGPDHAQRYADTVRPILDVIAGIAAHIPINEASRTSLEISAEGLKNLNESRAQAESVMNDPARAFLPRAVEQPSLLAACPERSPYSCNPIGVPMRVVRGDPRRSYTNECSMTVSESPPQATYLLVDCRPAADGMSYTVKRQAPRLTPELQTIVPTKTSKQGREIRTSYTGYRYLDPCVPCR